MGVVELHGYRRGILTFQSVIYKVAFKPSFFFFRFVPSGKRLRSYA